MIIFTNPSQNTNTTFSLPDVDNMQIHQIGGEFYDSNIYVIQSEKSIVLDCGTGQRHEKILKNLKDVIDPSKVNKIVLSHRHYDHTGGAEGLQEALEAELLVHETAAEALRSGDEVTTAASAFGMSFPKLEVTALSEGDEIDLGDVNLKVLHIPGHSICSMALWEESSKTLFSGDTVYTDGGIGRWDLPTGDGPELMVSLNRLKDMDLSNLYPGHGPSSEGDGNKHIALGVRSAQMYGL
jgi:glyoxylase-like metal-dependent hydrolase (beta-lactamase superfamily II)